MTLNELEAAQAKTQEILHGVTESLRTLAVTVVAHDNQNEALIQISDKNHRDWQDLQRQFRAYLKTLPRH